MKELWSNFKQIRNNQIDGRNVWLWLCETPIGDINVVQYEEKEQYITTFTYYNDASKAEKKFKQICKKIVEGTM